MHGTITNPTAIRLRGRASEGIYLEGSREKGVLLIHGLTGAPAEMHFIARELNRLGFTVHVPRLAGHCQGAAALKRTTYEDWIDGLETPLVRLRSEVRQAYTAGICVGGILGLMLAQREGARIEKSAIYSPNFYYDGWNQPKIHRCLVPLASSLIRMFGWVNFQEVPPYGIRDERMRRFVVEGAEQAGVLPYFPAPALYQSTRLTKALRATLPLMAVPLLLVHSRLDDVASPRSSEEIQKLHGGHCELAYLEDSYHLIHVDRERNQVAKLTGEFFGLPAKEEARLAAKRPVAEEPHGTAYV
jgi:carboxylesterase